MSPLLLDTCAIIWLGEKARIAKGAEAALAVAESDSAPVYISPITGWEIGMLVANGRLRLPLDPVAWFERMLATPAMRLAELSPQILINSSFLPGSPPNDPSDRIMAATARENGYCLMTRDKRLLKYAQDGHLQAIAC